MALVEVFVGAMVKMIFEKLGSVDFLKFVVSQGLDTKLKKWRKMLVLIQAVLGDAEDKQNVNVAVRQWLNDLQDLAYDLEDVVDELATEACKKRLMEAQRSTSKVRKFIPTRAASLFSIRHHKFNHRVASKMGQITVRLKDLIDQTSILQLVETVGKRPNRMGERFLTTSLVDESHVFGREKDKEEILRLLLSGEPSNDDQVLVIPVVGMGGVGKTTLAQLVYNDDRVNQFFDLKAWACVQDDFDILRITMTILKSITSGSCSYEDLNMVQVELKKMLTKKRFLLVLDDVWNEKYEDWEILRRPLLVGSPGSKIIVTTRDQKVASIMSFTRVYGLKELSDDDSLSLLAKHALENQSFHGHPDLEDIGKLIVKKCKSLPLAVKTLAGLLRGKSRSEEWEDVLNSEIWDLGEGQSDILPALRLSYHHLPSQLKQCFAYCSIFPKDYEFEAHELVLLWMAEGFLQYSKEKKVMEDIGESYFKELVSRSFFQASCSNSSRFVMHDLINDLAQYVASTVCSRLTNNPEENIRCAAPGRVRYASFNRSMYESAKKFEILATAGGLRCFLPLPLSKEFRWSRYYLSNKILTKFLPKWPCLRVLSLSGYFFLELPDSISEMKQLRYLNLSGTPLECLPESLSALCNLETLILHSCYRLANLPNGIGNLINLRHLVNSETYQLKEMPSGISQLTSLQTLSKVVVSKGNGLRLKDLGNLPLLHGRLSIQKLHNVINVQEARDANLGCKTQIDEITLSWKQNRRTNSSRSRSQLDVLESLRPHENLRSVGIEFYDGVKFSAWVGDSSFTKLEKVTLRGCLSCSCLPSLGQLPLLKELTIESMNSVRTIGAEFYSNSCFSEKYFSSLESLTFLNMPMWETWSSPTPAVEECHFPSLRELRICRCPKLTNIPLLHLPSLRRLELERCGLEISKKLHNLNSLAELELENIDRLKSLEELFVQFPSGIEDLQIHNCYSLQSLWGCQDPYVLPLLRNLSISNCMSLEFLPILSGLEELKVRQCSSLRFLANIESPWKIRHLEIKECEALNFISEAICEDNITSIERLTVHGCPNLNLRIMLCSAYSFASLGYLSIEDCECTNILAAPNLVSLSLRRCNNVSSLLSGIGRLRELSLKDCSSLESFPEGDFPSDLEYLHIENCTKLKPLAEWGVNRVTSLIVFYIGGGYPDLVSFSGTRDDEQGLLPPMISRVSVASLPNLKSLSKLLQNLTALECLDINDCPKLQSLPREILSERLQSLKIYGCPLLDKRCLMGKGDYWPMIADIPHVRTDSTQRDRFYCFHSFQDSDSDVEQSESLDEDYLVKPRFYKDYSFQDIDAASDSDSDSDSVSGLESHLLRELPEAPDYDTLIEKLRNLKVEGTSEQH